MDTLLFTHFAHAFSLPRRCLSKSRLNEGSAVLSGIMSTLYIAHYSIAREDITHRPLVLYPPILHSTPFNNINCITMKYCLAKNLPSAKFNSFSLSVISSLSNIRS